VNHSPASHHSAPSTVEDVLAAARAELVRLTPVDAHAAICGGALLVDIRSDRQRATDGVIPGAHVVERNVLEWRLDPACQHRDPLLGRRDARLVLICDEGYQSSLAAASVQRFGRRAISDVVGGFRAWRAAGLPVDPYAGTETAGDLGPHRDAPPPEGGGLA
jgi:rhodanese-related sulfurtransferase